VATISGNTVTIVGAGSTLITASQAGDANYEAAPDVAQTLTVNKADQIITIDAIADKLITDADFNVTASTTSGEALTYVIQSGPATISGTTITLDGTAGTVVVEVSQAGTVNYNAASNTTSFVVTNPSLQDQTITFDALATKTFGDADFDLTATASSTLAVTYSSSDLSVATVSDSTVTIIGAGTTLITASQAGDNTFNPAPNVAQTLTVNKAEQTVSIDAIADKLITDADFNVVASTTSGEPLTYAIQSGPATISGTTISLDGTTGTVVIEVSQSGTANYNAASSTTSFVVNDPSLQNQSITFDALVTKTYGDADFDLTATASSTLAVTYSSSDLSVATVSDSTVTIIGAGTCIITASQAGDATFNAADDVEQTLTVNKADQTISLDAIADKLITDADFEIVASATSNLDISLAITGPATLSGTTLTLAGTEGTVTVTASQAGDTNYNAAMDVEVSFNVTAPALADQTITFDAIEDQILEDGSLTLTATASSGLEVAYEILEGPATITSNILSFTDLGVVVVKASQAGNDAFNPALPVEQSFEIVTVTGIEFTNASDIHLYPNPVKNYIQITGAYNSLKIFDMNGSIVSQSADGKKQIDISKLQSGNYIIMISSKDCVITNRFIKK